MNLEVSTINVLLSLLVGLQGWLVYEVFSLRTIVRVMLSHCPHCRTKKDLA